MPVELCIVIVNWNGGELLHRCIESLVQSPPSVSHEIVVVDNASTDESVQWLRSDMARTELDGAKLRLIENSSNFGFGKANNQAIASSEAPLLFLLNNDTEVRPGAIDSLIATLKSQEGIGACGPRLSNSDGSLQISAWRNPPTAWEVLINGLRLYRLIPRRARGEFLLGRHWDHARRRQVDMLSAAAILLKREVIEDVGGFDERFHMYAEDNEWCLRVVRAGWRLVFEPDAEVLHHGAQGSSARWTGLERQLRIVDEGLRFQRFCLPRRQLISNILANSVVVLLAHVWKGITGKPKTETRMKLGLYLRHLKRALREKE